MAKNSSLETLRVDKYDIYRALRKVLAFARKHGVELYELDPFLRDGRVDDVTFNALKTLNNYLDKSLLRSTEFTLSDEVIEGKLKYTGVLQTICQKYNDEISEIMYKRDVIGKDAIFFLMYIDRMKSKNSRMDTFIVNTEGKKR